MEQAFEIGLNVVYKLKETQSDKLVQAGKIIAHSFMNGHKFFVSGSGHSHTLAEEFYARAGTLAFTIPILTNELTLTEHPTKSSYIERLSGYASILANLYNIQENDVVLIASNSGRNAYPVELALEAKKRNAYVIAVTSIEHTSKVSSRHESGKKLIDVADLVIDNCGAYGDSSLLLEGMSATICPTSSIANSFIAQAISVACCEELLQNNIEPPVYVSLNCDGNEKVNEVLFKKYTRMY